MHQIIRQEIAGIGVLLPRKDSAQMCPKGRQEKQEGKDEEREVLKGE